VSVGRFHVGCAGQFVLGQIRYFDDFDTAIVAAQWPAGCDVYDSVTQAWVSPTCQDEIAEARGRLEARGRSHPSMCGPSGSAEPGAVGPPNPKPEGGES
jgi:hypothetical protein